MIDRIYVNALLDCYGILLTKKQQDLCDLYYRQDLSYNEIAQLENISRTAVYETVRTCTETLNDYEAKLHLVEQMKKRHALYEKIRHETDNPSILKLVDQCEDTEI